MTAAKAIGGVDGWSPLGPAFQYQTSTTDANEDDDEARVCVYPEISSRPTTPVSPYFSRLPTTSKPKQSYPTPPHLGTAFSYKSGLAPSSSSSPRSPALSVSSSCLEDGQKKQHTSYSSSLRTPPSRSLRQTRKQLLTPPITLPDKSTRKPTVKKGDDDSDLIIVKRRKLNSPSPSTPSHSSNISPLINSSPDITSAKRDTNPTTFISNPDRESYTLNCTPTCIYTASSTTTNYEEITLICCDSCDTWQHNKCLGLSEEADELPELFYCGVCRPGWVSGLIERSGRNAGDVVEEEEESAYRGGDVFLFVEGDNGSSTITNMLDEHENDDYLDNDNTFHRPRSNTLTTTPAKVTKGKGRATTPTRPSRSQPIQLAAEQRKPINTYKQHYSEIRKLFAGSSKRGREEVGIVLRRDNRCGRSV